MLVLDKIDPSEYKNVQYEKRLDAVSYYTGRDDEFSVVSEGIEVPLYNGKRKIIPSLNRKLEDSRIFNFLIGSCIKRETNTIAQSGELTTASLNYGFFIIEKHYFSVNKIIMHSSQYVNLRVYMGLNSDKQIWGADILINDNFSKNEILIMSAPEHVGVLSICNDLVNGISILDINSISLITIYQPKN